MWALGISAIEMAELSPPRWKVHPLRVIFMIIREAAPRLEKQPGKWSQLFHDFVAQCLNKVCGVAPGLQLSRSRRAGYHYYTSHPTPSPVDPPPLAAALRFGNALSQHHVHCPLAAAFGMPSRAAAHK